MLKKMEQAKKKAEAVVNTVDISEREKMAQLKRYDITSPQNHSPFYTACSRWEYQTGIRIHGMNKEGMEGIFVCLLACNGGIISAKTTFLQKVELTIPNGRTGM